MDLGVPFYPQNITEDASVIELSKLFSYVNSSWTRSNVNVKVFSNGLTNKLIGCFQSNEQQNGENGVATGETAMVVRIFGKCTDKFLNRPKELAVQVLLSKAGFAPKVFVRFPNGVCYGYLYGQTITVSSVRDAHISTLIAEKLAAFHCLSLKDLLPSQSTSVDNLLGISKATPFLWSKLDQFLDIVEKECMRLRDDDRFCRIFTSVKAFREKAADLQSHIDNCIALAKRPLAVSFCHNDLLLNNILYDSQKDQIHFIDFEYADYNYVAFDIANHFVEYCGVDDVDFGRYPSADYQLEWIRKYLIARHALMKLGAVTDADVRLWFVFIQKFALASYLIWAAWALVQFQFSELDFDYFEFAVQRYTQYLERKEEFYNLSLDW